MRTEAERSEALRLLDDGLSVSEVARRLGIPRPTVSDWRRGKGDKRVRSDRSCSLCGSAHEPFARVPEDCYAYMLGLYLGDGCISPHPRGVFKLRLALDSKYPGIVAECIFHLSQIASTNSIRVRHPRGENWVEVFVYSKGWPCLFPQHGIGKKHDRAIVLQPCQWDIVESNPFMMLRGLIHSDGCRVLNNRGRMGKWTGVRYLFSNRSEDILEIFCATCRAAGLHYTRPNSREVSIAKAVDTAKLDVWIGQKV